MSLKTVYRPYFKIGAAVPAKVFEDALAQEALRCQYDSFTCENEMKPQHLLDEVENRRNAAAHDRCPAVSFQGIRRALDFARENGMKMRGHTLVWHNQTPRWFFAEGYSDREDAPLADRETMLARLEGYIRSVLGFVQEEYPGIIYAWDVVNEAVEDGALRRSWWTETVGEDFILQAFRFARKYSAPGVDLFYNDYDTFVPWKRDVICEQILKPLMAEGIVDGIGMQSHMTMQTPSLEEYEKAVSVFGALGLQVQVTELDIHNPDPSRASMEALAARYREVFTILTRAKKEGVADITCVTFWGMQDDDSWLTGFRGVRSYPLLFADGFRPKSAYQAVLSVPGWVEEDGQDRLPGGERFEFWETTPVFTKEYHVNPSHPQAGDENDGSPEHPFATIQAAANLAGPGTRVWIHGGVYRECVRPARGGNGPEEMVSYEAFGDGEVIIKASVTADSFCQSEGWNLRIPGLEKSLPEGMRIWETRLKPEEFKGYNPFCAVNILHDRLFIEYEKTDMTTYLNRRGMVFCDGKPLKQVALYYQLGETPGSYWVEANGQTVHFRLEDDGDPAGHLIELTCREQCFAPEIPFLSYIRVKGLTCAHAATGAPVPQRGAISCYRGHHWIIEDCKIDWSNGVGIDIGNECWHHTYDPDQIIGHTVIRGCEIKDAGVCGIAGMFATDLLIEDNRIEGTGWQKMELSWEAGGIKVHNSVNSLIRRNIFTKTFRADHLWMDVGNENNRITRNLFLDGLEQREAIFIECSRDGINLIDNNIFWNVEGRFRPEDVPAEPGSTGWYKMEEKGVVNGYAVYGEGTDRLHVVNNLIGRCRSAGYFVKPVAFRIAGNGRGGTSREARIMNNLFYDCGEAAIKFPTRNNDSQGNLYVKMPGGYLRILYPAPENCLDLDAWREFYGFDREGQEGWFNVNVDTEKLTLEFAGADSLPEMRHHGTGRQKYVTKPEEVLPVAASMETTDDFYGPYYGDCRVPGPFAKLEEGKVYELDPRKYRK
ncbi:MAG: endo-1,4-beta-xylanase [Clostridium sp.]|nr:endo-1,4-beta-xylanase [Clostridium sp.]